MSDLGWMSLVRLFRHIWTREAMPRTRAQVRRKTIPSLESLEGIELLSTGAPPIGAAVRFPHTSHHRPDTPHIKPHGTHTPVMAASPAPVTLPAQTLSIDNTLTNFADQPLSPALNLFDPTLGTLLSVAVSQSATLQSNITSQNLSPTSATTITASLTGSYQITGLNQPISQPAQTLSTQPMPAGPLGSGSDTVNFPPVLLADSSAVTFTDPASLAFFTSAPGRATLTPAMTATAAASATAPNGNLFTTAQTSASATVTVSYTYLPVCPTPGTVGRIGLHHQRTLLILPFNGPVDPNVAERTSNYAVFTRDGRRIPIISAHYNPATNSVTLIPARHLNVHLHFRLSATLPCPNGQAGGTVSLPFGSKWSLIGFHDRRGHFVPVQAGEIVRFRHRSHASR